MATIKDVAKRAGVTIGTVSRVLNNKKWVSEEVKKKVLASIRDLRYKPQVHARRLRQKYSQVWGVIAPHHTALFKSPFFSEILAGLEDVSAEINYRLLVHPLNDATRAQLSYRTLLGDGSVDGMFVLNAWSTDVSIRELDEAGVPFVLVNGKITGQEDLPYVGVNNQEGVRMALDHLIQLGHKKIGMINGRMTTGNAIERFQAFQNYATEKKIEVDASWVVDGNFEEVGGYEACKRILLSAKRPTALLCASDVMAMGAFRALKDAGLRVPDQMSIVGFDNMEETRYHSPGITTVAFSPYEMGKLAAQKLIQLIHEETLKQKISTLKPKLIERESTKPNTTK